MAYKGAKKFGPVVFMEEKVAESVSVELFCELVRIRMVEEAIGERYVEWKMRCPVHLSIGQEAIAVGVCKALLHGDYLVSNHRAHAHYLAKGGSLRRMVAEIYGKVGGCSGGRGGSMHLVDLEVGVVGTTPIVGSSIPVGVGVAFASQLQKKEGVTAIFFGEGATEEGVWAESLNFAALRKLSTLFVCENNLYSVYSPLEVRQSEKRSRIEIARAHGMAVFHGDGNDTEVVHGIALKAVEYVRSGKGPCFVEFDTYRYREHCGPYVDDDPAFRPAKEVAYWMERCPVKLFEKSLRERGLVSDELLADVRRRVKSEIDEAFAFAESSPFPVFDPTVEVTYA